MKQPLLNLTSDLEVNSNDSVHSASWLSLIAYYKKEKIDKLIHKTFDNQDPVEHIRPDKKYTRTDTEIFMWIRPEKLSPDTDGVSGETGDEGDTSSDSPLADQETNQELTDDGATRGMIVIGCRGSEPSSLSDWLFTDFNHLMIPSFGLGFTGAKVHAGFTAAVSSVWDELSEKLKAAVSDFTQPPKILITGHSLGGALSVLIAAYIARLSETTSEPEEKAFWKQIKEQLEVQTFGAPRVGNQEWADWFDSHYPEQLHQHVYHMDLVPRVPPRQGFLGNVIVTGWEHCGQQHYYDSDGHRVENAPERTINDVYLIGQIIHPLKIQHSAYDHLPWLYYFTGQGLVTGHPRMVRVIETVSYVRRFAKTALWRLAEDSVGFVSRAAKQAGIQTLRLVKI